MEENYEQVKKKIKKLGAQSGSHLFCLMLFSSAFKIIASCYITQKFGISFNISWNDDLEIKIKNLLMSNWFRSFKNVSISLNILYKIVWVMGAVSRADKKTVKQIYFLLRRLGMSQQTKERKERKNNVYVRDWKQKTKTWMKNFSNIVLSYLQTWYILSIELNKSWNKKWNSKSIAKVFTAAPKPLI